MLSACREDSVPPARAWTTDPFGSGSGERSKAYPSTATTGAERGKPQAAALGLVSLFLGEEGSGGNHQRLVMEDGSVVWALVQKSLGSAVAKFASLHRAHPGNHAGPESSTTTHST